MSTSTALLGSQEQRRVLWSLARIHARRFLLHPVFLIGLLAVAGGLVQAYVSPDTEMSSWDAGYLVYPLWLGLPGLVVAYRLTVTEDKALALLPSAPTDQRVRTLALYAACLVPVVATVVLMALYAGVNVLSPAGPDAPFIPRPDTGEIGWVAYVATQLEIVVASFGGPALGVTVARWLRFPGAGVLAAVVLFLVEIVALALGEGGPAWQEWWARALTNAMPYVYWKASPEGTRVYSTIRPGSPTAHLVYAMALCGLAVTAGVLKNAAPPVKAAWRRAGWILLAVAAAAYAVTLLG